MEGLKIKDSHALLLDKCMHHQAVCIEISGYPFGAVSELLQADFINGDGLETDNNACVHTHR